MKIAFTSFGFSDYVDCQADKRILKKLNSLIKDIERNGPLYGIGKPERLKHMNKDAYSRRIDEYNRLIYEYDDMAEMLTIISCRGHYDLQ